MNNHDLPLDNGQAALPFNLKDVLAAGFRYKRTALLCFFGILTGATLAAVLQPAKYTASTEFLVGEGRVDPVVSTDASVPTVVRPVSEEELNSEIELLHSPDVLRQVVIACGLDREKTLMDRFLGEPEPEPRIAQAADRLGKHLRIELVKKSDLIAVDYTSRNPQAAVQVLRSLTDAYLQKHVAVHSPPGEFDFFAQETERYKKDLSDAEAQLKQFSQQEDGVAPQITRDLTLQKLSEFRSSLQQTRAEIASTEQRIRTLGRQAGITPERLTTSSRHTDDAQVLQSLKTTLINLELKRTELLTKYQPTYPLVQEVDKQISETNAAIAAENSTPIREETTDRNPTYAWISEELAKAKAEHSGLEARAAATEAAVAKYETIARDLAQKELIEQDLQRTVKANEENYLLYLRKREQARMTEALDRTRILNVAVAEPPVAPSLPSNSPWPLLFGGVLLAAVVSVAAVVAKEYLDPSFRTPAEVAAELDIPVLAAVPFEGDGFVASHANGSGPGDILGLDRHYSTADSGSLSNMGAA
jgi:uncharacterized protein involved in exopolysaccharide biosynthesis